MLVPFNLVFHSPRIVYLDDVGEVLPSDVVVSLDENLSQPTLTDRVVLGIELVKAVKSVPILEFRMTS